jgi:hypothetical protein
MKNLILIIAILSFLNCCKKDNSSSVDLKTIDTIDLSLMDCKTVFEQSSICFDSVLSDSRCPKGGVCVWTGNAAIKIGINLKGIKHQIELNTISNFQTDSTVDNLYISLAELSPYPEVGKEIHNTDYKANLIIANLDKLESNAQVISFNPEKCGCCWGWTIKMGNDTIKSDDGIIGQRIGFCFNNPMKVYIELGELEKTCSEMVGRKYYKIRQIIKTK